MHNKWRMRMAIGFMVGAAALYPLIASGQESQPNTPSGGVVNVGGVTAPEAVSPAAVEGITTPSGGPAAVAGAQGQPLTLPNTGGGPAGYDDGVAVVIAGIAGLVLASGAFHLRRRGSRPRVGG